MALEACHPCLVLNAKRLVESQGYRAISGFPGEGNVSGVMLPGTKRRLMEPQIAGSRHVPKMHPIDRTYLDWLGPHQLRCLKGAYACLELIVIGDWLEIVPTTWYFDYLPLSAGICDCGRDPAIVYDFHIAPRRYMSLEFAVLGRYTMLSFRVMLLQYYYEDRHLECPVEADKEMIGTNPNALREHGRDHAKVRNETLAADIRCCDLPNGESSLLNGPLGGALNSSWATL
ncbi:uncharacterized protein TRIVIDRAFT_198053 [Trichoderma virens Gv29-8]|uniref:Uncharacterized protein n=1 Tax=Hypocrea virens (strain Gv29-8 / FGSC 10586) TaxID=413071 RepID=G9MGP4_HYPVG|nr:uncharacterized protein TRIVIDRAFT_198053 [Trichoderma virens Gv29-8]EHK26690.1 hypothetical protein TRIVIDRAFT_198053 [Trichoderma virens Gv29-8]